MNLYNSFVKNISFPFLANHYGLTNILGHLDDLDRSQFWSREKIEALQIKRLQSLLIHAYTTTQFYKSIFDEISLKPHEVTCLDDIKYLPFLTKDVIRKNGDKLLSTAYNPGQVHFSETGGTTGVKMKFWRDNACLSPKEAARYRFEKWTGWEVGNRMGLVWTAQQDYVGHWTTKAKIKNEGIIKDSLRPTTTKTRVIASSQHVVRIDKESKDYISKKISQNILDLLNAKINVLDAII